MRPHVVEVRHHEVGVVVLEVGRHDGQHQAGETTDGEQDDEGHRPQHRRLERQRATPHGADPVEHLHPGGDGDEHGGVHEVELTRPRHARREHVPKSFLRANAGTMADTIPNAGKIMM
ncbi:hypothetical protein G6F62_014443 [Rhizopus arrhizus]|nr:hypothetical protein G6F62_014443 [Rhizopus arrhizus]